VKPAGSEVLSCTLITTPANEPMAQIHNERLRMPAVLREHDHEAWLNGSVVDAKAALDKIGPGLLNKMRRAGYRNSHWIRCAVDGVREDGTPGNARAAPAPRTARPVAGGVLPGLRPDTRAVDGDGVTALAQAAQECLGECGVSEEVLPGRVWEVSSHQRRLAPIPVLQELEEDVGLFWFYVRVPQLICLRYA
jgi:hypothetical protein